MAIKDLEQGLAKSYHCRNVNCLYYYSKSHPCKMGRHPRTWHFINRKNTIFLKERQGNGYLSKTDQCLSNLLHCETLLEWWWKQNPASSQRKWFIWRAPCGQLASSPSGYVLPGDSPLNFLDGCPEKEKRVLMRERSKESFSSQENLPRGTKPPSWIDRYDWSLEMHVCKKNTELRAGRPLKSPYTLIHGHTHTRTHTETHAHGHTHKCIHGHTHKCTHTQIHMYTYGCTQMH